MIHFLSALVRGCKVLCIDWVYSSKMKRMNLKETLGEERQKLYRSLTQRGADIGLLLSLKGSEVFRMIQNGDLIPVPEDSSFDRYLLPSHRVAISLFHLRFGSIDGFIYETLLDVVRIGEARYLVRSSGLPVFNQALVERMQLDMGLDIDNQRPFVNPINGAKDIQTVLAGTAGEIVDEAMITFPFQHRYLQLCFGEADNGDIPLRLADEKNFIFTPKFGVVDSDVYPFSNAYELLLNQNCCQALVEGRKFRDIFLDDLLTRALADGKSVLIAEDSREGVERFRAKLSGLGFKNVLPQRFFGDEKYSLAAEAMHISMKGYTVGAVEHSPKSQEVKRQIDGFIDEAGAHWALGTIESGEDSLTGLNKFSYYRSLRKVSFALDASYYTSEDYSKDETFFKEIKKFPFVYLSSLTDNPLHSYRAKGRSIQVFNAMKELLSRSLADLEKFQADIAAASIPSFGDGSVDNIGEYLEIRAKLSTLLKYDGFSSEFFQVARDPSAVPLALRLNSAKQNTNQLYEELCEFVKDIDLLSKLPLKAYLDDLKSGSFFRSRRAKRAMRRALRDHHDLPIFIRCLTEYIDETSELDRAMKDAESLFGLVQYLQHGPARILAALEFVSDYERMIKLDSRLDRTTNPLVERIFEDAEFREREKDLIREADYAFDALQTDRKNLSDFFSDNIIGDDIPFAEIRRRIEYRNGVDVAEFTQYMSFLLAVDRASYTIQQGIQAYGTVDLTMSSFENDYWYSLYKSLAKLHYKGGVVNPYPVYQKIHDSLRALDEERHARMFAKVSNTARNAWWSSREGEMARTSIRYASDAQPYQLLQSYWGLAQRISPLQIQCLESSPLVSNDMYDLVVIVDSKRFSSLQLAQAIGRGRRVIVIDLANEKDARISGYPVAKVDLETLYRGPLNYDLLSSDFMDLLTFGFDSNGFELQTAEESDSPMPLSYLGKDGIRRCVIPYTLIGERQFRSAVIGCNATLMRLGLSPVVLAPCMALVVDPTAIVGEMDQQAEAFEAGAYRENRKK